MQPNMLTPAFIKLIKETGIYMSKDNNKIIPPEDDGQVEDNSSIHVDTIAQQDKGWLIIGGIRANK